MYVKRTAPLTLPVIVDRNLIAKTIEVLRRTAQPRVTCWFCGGRLESGLCWRCDHDADGWT